MSQSILPAVSPLFLLLAACGSASGTAGDEQAQGQMAIATTPTAPEAVTIVSSNIGTNASDISYWAGSRPFTNLIYGSAFTMSSDTAGGNEPVPAEYLDASGWVKSLPAGYHANRILSIPDTSADIVCTYDGSAAYVNVAGPVSNVIKSPGSISFHYESSYPAVKWATIWYAVDSANYLRNLDCREPGARTAIDQGFVDAIKGHKVFRFMGWVGVNGNSGINTAFPKPTITWATRNKPGDGSYMGADGVPVEVMVAIANAANVDPWFTIPWNADDDYVTRFATYVRDNLAPGHVVYVENSNEVWNWSFKVARQAQLEGEAEGLSPTGNDTEENLYRYAEKTQHLMKIWSDVFAGQTNRLVRVAAFQNVAGSWIDKTLAFRNFADSVDAVATAPYFAFMQKSYTGQSLDEIMNTVLPAQIASTLDFATNNKKIADKYGKRYIAYEGGQHVVLPDHVDLLTQIERDPRMYDLYKRYMEGWNSQAGGDILVLTNLQAPINKWGAWGNVEYIGQPISLSTTPKMWAVREFLGSGTSTETDTPPSTTTYQTCSDGSVILSTSVCPSTSVTSRTPPGKKTPPGKSRSKKK